MFNLKINKYDCVGIVGPSGSGKTTLINIISGLIKINKGSIKINEHNLNDISKDWQKKIGYVPQSIYLLDESIKKNIAFELDESLISDEKN